MNRQAYSYKRTIARYKSKRTGRLKGHTNANSESKRLKSKGGIFKLAFTRMYDNMSEQDIELKEKYGLSLVANFHGVNKTYIHLKDYNDNFGTTSKTKNYYVMMGKIVLGKLSIREQTMLKGKHLIFTYKNKIDKNL